MAGREWGFGQRQPSLARQRQFERISAIPPSTGIAQPDLGHVTGPLGHTNTQWNALFPRGHNQIPSPWVNAPMAPATSPDIGQPAGNPEAPQGTQGPPAPLTSAALPQLVTPPTHADVWGDAALTGPAPMTGGWQTGNPLAILNKYQTPGTVAYVRTGNDPTDQPFRWGDENDG